jgi:hypothetical protein
MSKSSDEDTEYGLVTQGVIEDWLNRKAITLWDAALIANGVLPGTDPGGYLKLPHLWPGQNPPSDSGGTGTVYAL